MHERRAAIFLDRDGVLVHDRGIVTHSGQLELIDGVRQALRSLKTHGYRLVVITNQAVVARGLLSLTELEALHQELHERLDPKRSLIDAFYACPHHPHANDPRYRLQCLCRKPQPGLLLRAERERNVDLKASVMIGDRMSDILAGRRAGTSTILFESGCHKDPPIVGARMDSSVKADHRCASWSEVLECIFSREIDSKGAASR